MQNRGAAFFFPIWLTVFIDFMGIGIVVPIFAPLMLDQTGGVLPLGTSLSTRGILLGFLIGCYALAQFFGAPILGRLSDRYGRKPLLLISIAGTAVAYAIQALGIVWQSMFWMYFARILCGFNGGNTSIAQSAVADLSDEKSKGAYFGYLALAMGLGFTLGPVIGGRLADPHLVSWFDFTTPFWFTAILGLFNTLLIWLFFHETLTEKKTEPVPFFAGLRDLRLAFTLPGLRTIFAVFFLFVTGWFFFALFFQVFLIQKFDYNQTQIGDTYTYIGLCYAVFQGLIAVPLSKRIPARWLVGVSLFVLFPLFLSLLIPKTSFPLFFIYPFLALFVALAWPNILGIVSNLAPPKRQGEILGLNQAIQSFSQGITPIIAGTMVAKHPNVPTIISAAAMALAWLIFIIDWKHFAPKRAPQRPDSL